MEEILFVTMAMHVDKLSNSMLLVESLRAFGGKLADSPVVFLHPSKAKLPSNDFTATIEKINATIIPIEIEDSAIRFPLGLLPFAAAAAEELFSGENRLLAWVLPDTLFFSPPECFLLPKEKRLGYRPVHHSNIGSPIDQEIDPYWTLVYRHCAVTEADIFPMNTCTRDKVLRPYINAGMLVVHPEDGFLRTWRDYFKTAYQREDLQPLLQNWRYAIFLHQAILAGVMMNQFSRADLEELPEGVNYPLHLHDEYHPEHRPTDLDQLITCRYESFAALKAGMQSVNVKRELKTWLEERIL